MKEQQSLHESQKLVADFREELQIKEGTLKQAQAERDQLQGKLKEHIFKIQQLQETIAEKDDNMNQL